ACVHQRSERVVRGWCAKLMGPVVRRLDRDDRGSRDDGEGTDVASRSSSDEVPRSFWGRRWREVKTVARSFRDDRIPRKAAALSYYTVFSLAPLLVIAVAIVGLIFGAEAARDRIVSEFRSLIGESGGEAIAAMVEHSRELGANLTATTVGLI